METIALLGATGAVGRSIGRILDASGRPYRAVSRSQMGLEVRFSRETCAERVIWDAEEPGSVRASLEGATTAVYLVGMPVWEFQKHLPLTRRVLAAAQAAGVQRLLLVSSNWAYGRPQAANGNGPARVSETHPLHAETAKGRVRAEQEQMVLASHGTIATAVLRIGDFYGPWVEASYLWSAFRAARNGVPAQLMSPCDAPHEFVYVPDAARTILRMLETLEIWGRAWNLGGHVGSIRAMTEAIFAEAGQPAHYQIPPPWKMRLVAMMNPYVREMREMQYLLETPVLLDDSALEVALGGLPKTEVRQAIRETLPTVRVGR